MTVIVTAPSEEDIVFIWSNEGGRHIVGPISSLVVDFFFPTGSNQGEIQAIELQFGTNYKIVEVGPTIRDKYE